MWIRKNLFEACASQPGNLEIFSATFGNVPYYINTLGKEANNL